MKFNKHRWERKEPLPNVTLKMVESKITSFFSNHSLEHFEVVNAGLANLNIFFKLTGLNDSFLLRIYTRDTDTDIVDLECLLQQKFGHVIPMPEFLHIQNQEFPEKSFVIQRWLEGMPFYKLLESDSNSNLTLCAKSIAHVLSTISSQKFPKAGFFKNNLEIIPFDVSDNQHPFVSYIEDCLFKEHAGINLGDELRNKLWTYVKEHQHYFPAQEPACLVHGDFNFDNILIDPNSNKVVAILDWEFAFPGSYLFDIGTFLRFDMPSDVKDAFINSYEHEQGKKLPMDFEKMVKIQDITNLVGLINHPQENSDKVRDVKCLINEGFEKYP